MADQDSMATENTMAMADITQLMTVDQFASLLGDGKRHVRAFQMFARNLSPMSVGQNRTGLHAQGHKKQQNCTICTWPHWRSHGPTFSS